MPRNNQRAFSAGALFRLSNLVSAFMLLVVVMLIVYRREVTAQAFGAMMGHAMGGHDNRLFGNNLGHAQAGDAPDDPFVARNPYAGDGQEHHHQQQGDTMRCDQTATQTTTAPDGAVLAQNRYCFQHLGQPNPAHFNNARHDIMNAMMQGQMQDVADILNAWPRNGVEHQQLEIAAAGVHPDGFAAGEEALQALPAVGVLPDPHRAREIVDNPPPPNPRAPQRM